MDYVLIVESAFLIAAHVENVLRDTGFELRWAAHGQHALAHMDEHGAPAFVVTAIQMPVMGGIELAVAMKRDERWRDVPVLARSGVIETLTSAGVALFSGFLHKPSDDDELLRTVKEAIAERPDCVS